MAVPRGNVTDLSKLRKEVNKQTVIAFTGDIGSTNLNAQIENADSTQLWAAAKVLEHIADQQFIGSQIAQQNAKNSDRLDG